MAPSQNSGRWGFSSGTRASLRKGWAFGRVSIGRPRPFKLPAEFSSSHPAHADAAGHSACEIGQADKATSPALLSGNTTKPKDGMADKKRQDGRPGCRRLSLGSA